VSALPALALAHERIATVLQAKKQPKDAIGHYREAEALFTELDALQLQAAPSKQIDEVWRVVLGYAEGASPGAAIHYNRVLMPMRSATCLCSMGQSSAANNEYKRALPELEQLVRRSPNDLGALADLGSSFGNWADCLLRADQLQDAAVRYEQARDLALRVTREQPSNEKFVRLLASAYWGLMKVAVNQGNPGLALEYAGESDSLYQILKDSGETNIPKLASGRAVAAGKHENLPRVIQTLTKSSALARSGQYQPAAYGYATALLELESYMDSGKEAPVILTAAYEAAYGLGASLYVTGNSNAALVNLRKAELYAIRAQQAAQDNDDRANHTKTLESIRAFLKRVEDQQ
jgi:tetratricopeptide (TPR) repeat protein